MSGSISTPAVKREALRADLSPWEKSARPIACTDLASGGSR